MLCLNCNKETKNPKFCSRSCSAQQTNKKPKRKRKNHCLLCNTPILSSRKFCKDCRRKGKLRIVMPKQENNSKITIKIQCVNEDTVGDLIYNKFHRSAAHNKIRLRAKTVIKNLDIKACENCGYDKHIESAHIIPVSQFSLDTKVDVVNSPTNLIGLCPNCHWEFDRGLLPTLVSKIERLK